MKPKKIKFIIYTFSILLLLIPSLIVLMLDITLNQLFGDLCMLISFLFFVLGKTITVAEKKKYKQNFSTDIGIIFGVLTAIVVILLK